MRPRQLAMTVSACVGLALGAGCGNSQDEAGPGVPKETADALVRELDLAEERLRVTRDDRKVGSCQDIESKSIPAIETLLSQIPSDTDPQVVEALERSVERLRELSATECDDLAREIEQETETEPETLPTPTETTPETIPEEQTTPETTPEETPKEKKPKQNKGDDGGAEPVPIDPSQPGQGGGAVPGSGEDG